MSAFRIALCGVLLIPSQADVDVPATSPELQYVGRFDQTDAGARFDRNGCEIQFRVEGATELTLNISQRLTAKYASGSNPVGSTPQHFLVYVDGTPLSSPLAGSKCSYCTFDTSSIANETATLFTVVRDLSTDAHEIRVMKTTEPEYNDREPSPNWITFHGVSIDNGRVAAPSVPRRQRRIEFIGDSITAGYCNLCKGPGPFDAGSSLSSSGAGGEAQETFALSWPTLICEELGSECSAVAWSGLGLIQNCCGGDTFMPEIFSRTIATDESMRWDFSSWVPDALVVNLGTNDGGAGATPQFVEAYTALVHKASMAYGPDLHVFLACGPMSDRYCDSVQQTIDNATASGIHAHFLDHRGFLNGTFGPKCCGHPGAQVDIAIAQFGSKVIADTLGWSADSMTVVV